MKTTELNNDLSKVIEGVNKAANTIKTTMGGAGKVVLIGDDKGFRFTKDGVSVARKIALTDELENLGAKLLISSANKTVSEVGDGTTATSLLLQTLLTQASKHIDAGADVNSLIAGMQKAIDVIVERLEKEAITVKSTDQIEQIASTSSNDKRIGKLVKEVYDAVGLQSLVMLERSKYFDNTYYEVTKGVEFDSGYAHQVFITDKDTETCEFENPYIHITLDPVSDLNPELETLMNVCLKNQKPLVIIAPRFSDGFVRLCAMNKTSAKAMQVCLIKTPGFGMGVSKNTDDIRAFMDESNEVEKIVVFSNYFVMYNENTPYLNDRLNMLKSRSENAVEAWDEIDYANRYHKLKQSTAIIYAGGITPESRDEEFDRIEDSLGSVKAAINGGYTVGGGLALYRINDISTELFESEDHIKGLEVVLKSIRQPIKQILVNANESVEIILTKIDESDYKKGYNVKTRELEDFLEEGIIDPVHVLCKSLINAFASVKLLLNTSYVMYNE